MTIDDVGQLEDNAARRKERLAALKRKLQGQSGDCETGKDDQEAGNDSLPTPIFRSYKPMDSELKEKAFEVAEPQLIEDKIQVNLRVRAQD